MTSKLHRLLLKTLRAAALIVLGSQLQAQAAGPSTADEEREARLRSAFVYNFISFVEWPADEAERFVIGTWQDDLWRTSLEKELAGKTARGKAIEVKALPSETALKGQPGLKIITIGNESPAALKRLLEALGSQPVLTVSRFSDHCTQGVMICFLIDEGRLRFAIDKKAAEKSGLKLGSQLLKLARSAP